MSRSTTAGAGGGWRASDDTINPLVPQAFELVVGLAVLVVVVTFAVVALVDAQRRGRSVALWLLAFLLTGPFGIVAYYVTRERVPTPTR